MELKEASAATMLNVINGKTALLALEAGELVQILWEKMPLATQNAAGLLPGGIVEKGTLLINPGESFSLGKISGIVMLQFLTNTATPVIYNACSITGKLNIIAGDISTNNYSASINAAKEDFIVSVSSAYPYVMKLNYTILRVGAQIN